MLAHQWNDAEPTSPTRNLCYACQSLLSVIHVKVYSLYPRYMKREDQDDIFNLGSFYKEILSS